MQSWNRIFIVCGSEQAVDLTVRMDPGFSDVIATTQETVVQPGVGSTLLYSADR